MRAGKLTLQVQEEDMQPRKLPRPKKKLVYSLRALQFFVMGIPFQLFAWMVPALSRDDSRTLSTTPVLFVEQQST